MQEIFCPAAACVCRVLSPDFQKLVIAFIRPMPGFTFVLTFEVVWGRVLVRFSDHSLPESGILRLPSVDINQALLK